jgi:hypothetical protein
MAKAILEFDLNDSDDRVEHARMMKSLDILMMMHEYDQYLRSETRYNESLSQEEHDVLQKAREKFYELMNSRGISIDELLP